MSVTSALYHKGYLNMIQYLESKTLRYVSMVCSCYFMNGHGLLNHDLEYLFVFFFSVHFYTLSIALYGKYMKILGQSSGQVTLK